MVRVPKPPSLLVFDEPELHMHPSLLARVMDLFAEAAERHPVLITTHSDRVLDLLENPAESAVLCSLDRDGNTQLLRPNAASLAEWLEDYRGLGHLRAEGYESTVFKDSKE